MKISVVIPTYNRAHTIVEAVDCLLQQTRPPDEIIVVDDGSTDNTQEVLSGYEPPVLVLRQPNRGRSEARNAGLKHATGDLLALLDSDDTLPAHSIERRATMLEAHPEVDAVYSDTLFTDMEGSPLARYSQTRPGPRPSGDVFAEEARHNIIGPIHGVMFRRAALERAGWFDKSVEPVEDYDLWLRMAAESHFYYIDEPLAYYRVHEAMSTTTQSETMTRSLATVQGRAVALEAFQRLSGVQQARVHCSHGMMLALNGWMTEARARFATAVQAAPMYPGGYALGALALAGERAFRSVVMVRRRLRGDLDWRKQQP